MRADILYEGIAGPERFRLSIQELTAGLGAQRIDAGRVIDFIEATKPLAILRR